MLLLPDVHPVRFPSALRDILLGGSLLTLLACGSSDGTTGPGPGAPEFVTGCYTVNIGKWSGPRESANPPGAVVLMDSIGSNILEAGQHLVRPLPLSGPMPFAYAWWVRPAREHLDIVFSEGEGATILHLVWGWGDSTWRGTAQAITDVSPGLQATTTATLSPRTCPAE